MTRILLLGYDPETVDFSDPALPPGMSVEKVRDRWPSVIRSCHQRGS